MTQPLYGAMPSSSSISRRRRLADALLSNATDASPKGHWTQALAQGLNGYLAGRENRLADKEEGQRSRALAEALGGGKSPEELMALSAQYGAPELMDAAQFQYGKSRDIAGDQWRQSRAAVDDSQWAQGHQLSKQALDLRSQPDVPSGYRSAQGGNLEAIPGGPADPNKPMPARAYRPTTDQANAAGFFDRMKASNAVLSDPNVTQAAMSFGQGLMNRAPLGLGNYMTSPEYQKYDQASRDFVNAILRKESGAAISESEFQNARIQYFPQPGDTPEKIAQKAKNREIVINAMHRTAAPALNGGMATGAQSQPASMDFGEVGQIPEGAVVEDEQGARYRKENGTLVPVQ